MRLDYSDVTLRPLTDEERAVVQGARDIIADPDRWTQGDYALDGYGTAVGIYDDTAYRFCASGAIGKAAYDQNGEQPRLWTQLEQLLDEVVQLALTGATYNETDIKLRTIIAANDQLGREAALTVFDFALEQGVLA